MVALFFPLLSMGQIETDRPDLTESPRVVPHGAWQVETGFVWERSTEDHCLAEYYSNTTLNTTLIRYGVGKNTELRLNWSIDWEHVTAKLERIPVTACTDQGDHFESDTSFGQWGLSPVFLGLKHNLLNNERIAIGFLAHIYLPYGSEHFRVSRFAPEFLLPVTASITERFSLSCQPGMSWDGESVEPTGWITFSMAYAISDRFGMYVEPYSYRDSEQVSNRINGGFTLLIKDRLQYDFSAGAWDAGSAHRHPTYFLSTGLSYLLP